MALGVVASKLMQQMLRVLAAASAGSERPGLGDIPGDIAHAPSEAWFGLDR